jgi:S-DNA-T family DNA segregation ATPase FtsK/SpoIIIE
VVEVSVQKILSSAKSRTTAREIMGLTAAIGIINLEKAVGGIRPV